MTESGNGSPVTSAAMAFTAATPGIVPPDGQPTVGGVTLPPGRQVRAILTDDPTVVAWVTDDLLPADEAQELLRQLAAVFGETGLWPVVAMDVRGELEHPWHAGDFTGPDPEVLDAATALGAAATEQRELMASFVEDFEPSVEFRGLAADVAGADLDADALEAGDQPGGIVLVPVTRPADVPKVLGWQGPANHGLVGESVSAVLRSWEDRFGAVLVSLGGDTLLAHVARFPTDPDEIDLVVGEHHAFCPDNLEHMGVDGYRDGLTEWTHWGFWWD